MEAAVHFGLGWWERSLSGSRVETKSVNVYKAQRAVPARSKRFYVLAVVISGQRCPSPNSPQGHMD